MFLVRALLSLLSTVGWVVGALAFSAFSIAAVIAIAWLLQLAFPFLPDFVVVFAFLIAFAIYVLIVGWIGWRILKRRMKL